MKQRSSSKVHHEQVGCDPSSCNRCDDCKVVNLEERRGELKSASPQLYGKEAEYYSFYYPMNIKQSS
jgi:hypothetical protein